MNDELKKELIEIRDELRSLRELTERCVSVPKAPSIARVRELWERLGTWTTRGYGDDALRGGTVLFLIFIAWASISALYVREAVFQIPLAVSPYPGSTQIPQDILFKWRPIAGENVRYELEVDERGPNFTRTVLHKKDLEQTVLRVAELEETHAYYWRVRAVVEGQPRTWSAAYSFHTKYLVPK
ncbi:MAG: hypothetical protein HY579_09385 [Nitrospinae bacterium]|nr:hypothetical protein [Nitrospinota bacterium]